MSTSCKHEKIRTTTVIDGVRDIEQTICADKDCGFVLNEVELIEGTDGEVTKRPRHVSLDAQPEGFQFKNKDGSLQEAEDGLVSARAMMALAVKTREETVGKKSRELAREILDECAKNVLAGGHVHLIEEKADIPGEIVSLAVKELRSLGYKVKKTPDPGAGTWISIKWPTTNRKPKKKKGSKEEEQEFTIAKKKQKPRQRVSKEDVETQKKQRSAAQHRKEAMKAR